MVSGERERGRRVEQMGGLKGKNCAKYDMQRFGEWTIEWGLERYCLSLSLWLGGYRGEES